MLKLTGCRVKRFEYTIGPGRADRYHSTREFLYNIAMFANYLHSVTIHVSRYVNYSNIDFLIFLCVAEPLCRNLFFGAILPILDASWLCFDLYWIHDAFVTFMFI